MVTESHEPGDLSGLIKDQESLSEKDTREVIKTLIDVVGYCHSLGVIHRNIMAENVLWPIENKTVYFLKLSHFDLSKHLEEDMLTTTLCGTPSCLSPEIVQQKPS